jgi:hypothetical protein
MYLSRESSDPTGLFPGDKFSFGVLSQLETQNGLVLESFTMDAKSSLAELEVDEEDSPGLLEMLLFGL